MTKPEKMTYQEYLRRFVGNDFHAWTQREFGVDIRKALYDASYKMPSWRKIVREWLVTKKKQSTSKG